MKRSRWNVKADASKQELKKAASHPAQLSLGERARNEAMAWFWVVFVFLLINGTLGQARVIPSGSMQNTLLVGDHLIMSRVGYDAGIPFTNIHMPLWRQAHRHQIVIFKPPYAPNQTDLIKRVIGLPGDEVDIRAGAVWINGQKLLENYTTGPTEAATPWETPRGIAPVHFPYRVPANSYPAVSGDRCRAEIFSAHRWRFTCRLKDPRIPGMATLPIVLKPTPERCSIPAASAGSGCSKRPASCGARKRQDSRAQSFSKDKVNRES